MKKLFIVITILLTSTFLFAKTFDNNGEIIDKFLQYGSYLKVINDDSEIEYYLKSSILKIKSENNQFYIIVDKMYLYELKRYSVQLDENNNIIITKK